MFTPFQSGPFAPSAFGPSTFGPIVAAAVFVLGATAVAIEAIAARRLGRDVHDRRELIVTVLIQLGHLLIRALEVFVVVKCFDLIWSHRLTTLDAATPLGLAGLFLGYEFLYYWYHRAAHRVRWLWATHAVHHSATRLNLTAALRLGWTGVITGHFLFFAPLVWLGWSPRAVGAMMALDLAYQFFIHTELVPSLGPLEWVFNTPRHHSVHHASNDECLDRNFGGILIVFDRIFGTFAAPPRAPLRFGLGGREGGASVLGTVFGEWRRLAADLFAARSFGSAMRSLFGPP